MAELSGVTDVPRVLGKRTGLDLDVGVLRRFQEQHSELKYPARLLRLGRMVGF